MATPDSTPTLRLLCVEDNPDDAELIALALERADASRRYVLQRVETGDAFAAALAEPFDIVLCDYNLPAFSPYGALELLERHGSRLPLVVVTRAIGEDAAVRLLRSGARDYVTKDKLGTLPQVIDRVLEDQRRAEEKRRLDRELAASYVRLKDLSARFVQAQERERSIISRELHDQLGQSLTAIMLHLHATERFDLPKEAAEHSRTATRLAQEALHQLKSLSFSLRPAQLDHLGMVAAVRSAAERLAAPAGLDARLSVRGVEPQPLGENAIAAVRLAQEAITNTVRHARARVVQVRIRFLDDGRVGILVLDDGVGFDKRAVLAGGPTERNFGLYAMLERTELSGGRLQIRAAPGRGVAVRAII
jgi:signal transduction histidine kinase